MRYFKIIGVLLLVVLLLASCGGNNAEDESESLTDGTFESESESENVTYPSEDEDIVWESESGGGQSQLGVQGTVNGSDLPTADYDNPDN